MLIPINAITSPTRAHTYTASDVKQTSITHTHGKFASTRCEQDDNTQFVRGVSEAESIHALHKDAYMNTYTQLKKHVQDPIPEEHLVDMRA